MIGSRGRAWLASGVMGLAATLGVAASGHVGDVEVLADEAVAGDGEHGAGAQAVHRRADDEHGGCFHLGAQRTEHLIVGDCSTEVVDVAQLQRQENVSDSSAASTAARPSRP